MFTLHNSNFKFKVILLLLCAVSSTSFAQGIDFFKGSWSEALAKAKAQNKMIFVDFNTSWCGPCRKLARDVFPQKEVSERFNKSFVNVSIDAEKGEGPSLADKYGVKAYPTLVFVDYDGSLIYSFSGYRDAPQLLAEADRAEKSLAVKPELGKMLEKFVNGDKDKKLLLDIISLKKQVGAKLGDELPDYLQQLTPEEWYKADNYILVANLAKVYEPLTSKLLAVYKQAPDSVHKGMEKAVAAWLSRLLRPYIQLGKNDDAGFASVLDLKGKFGLQGSFGKSIVGGLIYLPDDVLHINYASHADSLLFMKLTDEYMSREVDLPKAEKEAGRQLDKQERIDLVNKLSFFGFTVPRYWQVCAKTEKDRQKCHDWAKYAFLLMPAGYTAKEYMSILKLLGYNEEYDAISKQYPDEKK